MASIMVDFVIFRCSKRVNWDCSGVKRKQTEQRGSSAISEFAQTFKRVLMGWQYKNQYLQTGAVRKTRENDA